MMDKLELQRLRDLPIEGVAERLGLHVVRHKALCPFHDDHHASLSFSVRRNTFRCFVCDAHGGTIDLAMRLLNKPFVEACRWLADEHNVILTEYKPKDVEPPKPFDAQRYERFFLRPWLSPEARRFLYDERRLDERVVRWCRLTSWRDREGVNWLQIPYYDREGKLIGVQNRNLVKNGLPRFRFPYGSRCSIYNLPVLNLLRPGEPLWITEGCSDCWAMLSSGHKAIAIPSATLLKPSDVEILSTLNSTLSTEYHMYPDRDEPGERLFLQLQQVLPNLEHHQLPPDCKDFSEFNLATRRGRPLCLP
ncbi:MAG: hypothetical protein II949_15575, partial [Prevotella sp.]|nr:hypothetical protein [Prevotella sp.]